MKQEFHNLLFRNGSFISPFKIPFISPYPTKTFQFQKSQSQVLDIGVIELPLLNFEEVKLDDYGNPEYALKCYHPELPNKIFRWRQVGYAVNKTIRNFVKFYKLFEMDFEEEGFPIVKISAGETVIFYDNPFVFPKIEMTDIIEPSSEMLFLMNGGILVQSYGKVALIDSDGVMTDVDAENKSKQIRSMFNFMLHYSLSNHVNGKKIRMIVYDVLTNKDQIKINSLRKQFNKKDQLTENQFGMLLRYYRIILEDIVE